MKKIVFVLLAGILTLSGCRKDDLSDIDFRQEMRNFVQEISEYAKTKDSGFAIIPQNGTQIISSEKESLVADLEYINAIDGIGQESLYYGYDKDDKQTPSDETNSILSYINLAVDNGQVSVLVTDYCSTQSYVDDSYETNHYNGFIGFAADDRELRSIPDYPAEPYNVNTDDIVQLSEARNLLYLINPEDFSSKENFISAIENTDYDIILIDLFFGDNELLSSDDVNRMKIKKNGATRMVICYMSIGEAEDYRYYWNPEWDDDQPEWLDDENSSWKGNYNVRYWYQEWKDVIFGSADSYLDKVISSGFDGVYLDIIDGFEFFEGKYE
ncbi:MAG: endo alpha-1,4 polygalactosaminidase [Bacteroidales bacterium]|nr:endo alpha-1,4 polygalactosaminidase [Bacteroidales bacterium]